MLRPLGFRIVIDLITLEEDVAVPDALAKSGFRIQAAAGDDRRTRLALEVGTVVAMGDLCYKVPEFGWYGSLEKSPTWQPWCKVGDKVGFGKYAGKFITDPADQKEYMLIMDEDVQFLIEAK